MKKTVIAFLLIFLALAPAISCADECMEGDCENGVGTGFTEEGQIYSGEWRDGEPHGSGKLTVSKGKYFEGRWENGQLVSEKKDKK